MSSGNTAARKTGGETGPPGRRTAALRQSQPAQYALEREAVERLGLFPNAFRAPEGAADDAHTLWMFTRAAYLDNPLPPLFKERLFIHLSRFCPWRYCIARHAASLLGSGHQAGDGTAPRQTVEQILALLRRPGRLRGPDLDAALSRLLASPSGVPEPETQAEADIFAAATELFLEPEVSGAALDALEAALGPRECSLLLTFLTFVRAIHHWTSMRRVELEEDVEDHLSAHEELARLVLEPPDPEEGLTRRLREKIAQLRQERCQRAEAVRRAELLQLALDAADQGAWDYDLVADAAHCDARTLELLGQTPEAPLTSEQVVNEAVHPEDRARVEDAVRTATDPAGDGRYEQEHRVVHRNGEILWLSVSGRTLFEGEGEQRRAVRMLGTVRDITSRIGSEERLRKSEERYRTLFNSIDQGFCVVEMIFDGAGKPMDYRFLETNASFERQTGLTDAVGKTILQLLPKLERHWLDIYGDVARTGKSRRYENVAAELGRYYEVNAFRVGKSHENRVGILFNDITARKATERALAESEERLAAALKGGKLGIYDYDPRTGQIDLDYMARHLLRIPGDEPVNYETFAAAIHSEDLPGVEEALRAALDPGLKRPYMVEFRVINRRPGETRWIRAKGDTTFRGKEAVRLVGTVRDLTRQKAAEEALAESERRFRKMADDAPVMIWVTEPDGNCTYLNKRWVEFTGQNNDKGLGFGWLDAVHPDDREQAHQAFITANKEKTGFRTTYRLRRKDGAYRWAIDAAQPRFGANRQFLGYIGSVLDITESKEIELALRQSEKRLTRLLDQLFAYVGVLTPDGIIQHVNRAPLEAAGLTLADVLGKRLDQIAAFSWDKGIQRKLRDAIRRAAKGESVRFDVRNRVADGQLRTIDFQIAPMRDEQGNVVGLIPSGIDIDDRVKAEQNLREREERLAAVLRAADLGSWHWNLKSDKADLNARYSEMLGYRPNEFEPTFEFFLDLVHPDDVERVKAGMRAHFEGKTDLHSLEIRMRHKDGHWVWIATSGRVIERDSAGRPLVMTGVHQDISGRVQAVQALREREERLAAVLRAADLGSWHWNVQADGGEINDRYAEMLGYRKSEIQLSFDAFSSFVHPDDMERVKKTLQEHFEGKTDLYSVEIRLRHKNGHWIWVLASGRVIEHDSAGRPLIMTGVHQDISGRVEAIQALRESESRFRHLANAAPVLIWMSGTDKHCTWFNKPWLDFVGRPMKEELGSGWTANVHPDDLKHCLATYDAAFNAHKAFSMEYRLRRHDGEYRWILDKGIPRYGVNGEFTGYIGTCLDITENKQTEFALRESEEQFRLLAENMSQSAWMADATGWTYWYNKRWFDYTGTTLEEMQGWGWRKVHHPDHVKRVVKKLSENFVTGEAWEDTFPLRGKDGKYRWFLSRALPIRDEKGRVVRWFGTNTDITERLRAEQDRELLVNELNHRVKNTLAIVQGIARQTYKQSGGAGRELTMTFQNRLAALAAAHNLLTRSNWEATSLRELAVETVRAGGAQEARVHIEGPLVVLNPKQAITFAMAFHELCTNATKYGALSAGSGQIHIEWSVSNGWGEKRLRLIWREHGGPPIEPPRRRGFGMRMIEEALAREVDGTVTMNFAPQGLVCTIEGRLDRNGNIQWRH